jgi:hypothetical protein
VLILVRPSGTLTLAGVNAAGLGPRVQVSPAIDYLAAKAVKGWPHIFVTPLREFVAITDEIKFGIPKDVVSVGLK